MQVLDRKSFNKLFDVLQARGFEVIGPVVRDGAIVYDHIESYSELPAGWTDRQGLPPRALEMIFYLGLGRKTCNSIGSAQFFSLFTPILAWVWDFAADG